MKTKCLLVTADGLISIEEAELEQECPTNAGFSIPVRLSAISKPHAYYELVNVLGDTAYFQQRAYPGDPPKHPNCRCTL
jgi:hypothetical protein